MKGIRYASIALLLMGGVSAALAQYPQGKFKQLDTNGDGVVDRDEYAAGLRASFAAMDQDRNGVVTLQELINYNASNQASDRVEPQVVAEAQMSAMDANRDGQITSDEFDEVGEKTFASFDKDHDGKLTTLDGSVH
ncbi:hypothetical protein [Pseudoxanthomonas sp.]|uniref:EF-hand domain-containing protein n=1 Tax=Pseudoxanthomonas sp. TaxID=1871049 RepID=UPI00260B2093|nr:hypothetical protein [Pseudoxanthomonas sp.]WDS34663.1 MAG: hypothetical protein O8I58_09650 [Pseudoxanthomonas sp.]